MPHRLKCLQGAFFSAESLALNSQAPKRLTTLCSQRDGGDPNMICMGNSGDQSDQTAGWSPQNCGLVMGRECTQNALDFSFGNHSYFAQIYVTYTPK